MNYPVQMFQKKFFRLIFLLLIPFSLQMVIFSDAKSENGRTTELPKVNSTQLNNYFFPLVLGMPSNGLKLSENKRAWPCAYSPNPTICVIGEVYNETNDYIRFEGIPISIDAQTHRGFVYVGGGYTQPGFVIPPRDSVCFSDFFHVQSTYMAEVHFSGPVRNEDYKIPKYNIIGSTQKYAPHSNPSLEYLVIESTIKNNEVVPILVDSYAITINNIELHCEIRQLEPSIQIEPGNTHVVSTFPDISIWKDEDIAYSIHWNAHFADSP